MKKLFLAVIALALLMTGFTACFAEEEFPSCVFDVDAYSMNGAVLNVTYADGTVEETGCWCFDVEMPAEGTTIGDILAGYDIVSIEPACEGDVFEGWLVFELAVTTDEYGFDEYTYVPVTDAPYTTEEMMVIPAPDYYAVYAAKWESIPAEDYFVYEDYEDYGGELIYMPAVTLYGNGGLFLFDADEDYEADFSVSTAEIGQNVGEVLELDSILDVYREGYVFTGWTVYDNVVFETIEATTDELESYIAEFADPDAAEPFWFEVFDGWYSIAWQHNLIGENMTTEEITSLSCGESDILIMAAWEEAQ